MNKELRKFGFSLGLGLNILGVIMFYRHRQHFIWFSSIGSFAPILAILSPKILGPVKKVMDFVILAIGQAVNIISLMIAFYLIFAPIGILLHLFGKDLLKEKIDKKSVSYWIERKKAIFSKRFYENMG